MGPHPRCSVSGHVSSVRRRQPSHGFQRRTCVQLGIQQGCTALIVPDGMGWRCKHCGIQGEYQTSDSTKCANFEHVCCTFLVIICWILPAITLRGLVYCASCAIAFAIAIAFAVAIAFALDSAIAFAIASAIAFAFAIAIAIAFAFALAIAFAMDSAIALATALAIASAIAFAIASLRL